MAAGAGGLVAAQFARTKLRGFNPQYGALAGSAIVTIAGPLLIGKFAKNKKDLALASGVGAGVVLVKDVLDVMDIRAADLIPINGKRDLVLPVRHPSQIPAIASAYSQAMRGAPLHGGRLDPMGGGRLDPMGGRGSRRADPMGATV
ncbi:MAG: hypothetical protein KDG50_03205 [Chromatiales bacterium]|nr:hypothetical protein [Chromatiales bacterium]